MIALDNVTKCECEACSSGRMTNAESLEMARQADALVAAALRGSAVRVKSHAERWASNTLQTAMGTSLNGFIGKLVDKGWGAQEIWHVMINQLLAGGALSLEPEFKRRWPSWEPDSLVAIDPALLPGLLKAIKVDEDEVIKH